MLSQRVVIDTQLHPCYTLLRILVFIHASGPEPRRASILASHLARYHCCCRLQSSPYPVPVVEVLGSQKDVELGDVWHKESRVRGFLARVSTLPSLLDDLNADSE